MKSFIFNHCTKRLDYLLHLKKHLTLKKKSLWY